jgi:hypothetical protein
LGIKSLRIERTNEGGQPGNVLTDPTNIMTQSKTKWL